MAEKGELVWLTALRRLYVQVAELICRAACRRVNEPPAVDRHVRAGAVQRLFGKHGPRARDPVGNGRHAKHIARPEQHAAIRHQEQLLAVREPRGCDVHIPLAKIRAVAPITVVAGHRDLVSRPATVADGPYGDVEVPVRLRRDVGDLGSVGREHRIGVDEAVVRQRPGLTRLDVQNLQLDGRAISVRGVDDPVPVW